MSIILKNYFSALRLMRNIAVQQFSNEIDKFSNFEIEISTRIHILLFSTEFFDPREIVF